ncbi:hypothetical protein MSTE_00929 [Mycobacteroides stephanolepidis]|uniref:Uncharacterized protein n=1 Tax=[Mycobacterium] stephanolepidis TaxID=1520670 RepID=A0A1Z4ETJ6_9MYCO|nr:DUF5994 family protein [[Mycobacterium] stephanolepidis]BAX96264.1 hypothetical protein MSTE_00929 [[Mycobacterium] stephanolepidis]
MTHHVFSKPRSGPAVRLRLKPKAPPTGHVDGAWWPYSRDLMGELPQLLRILSVRLGSIDRITYQVSEWSTVSRRILFRNRLTHLNWSLSQPVNTISAEGADGAHLTLLIVPPDTEALPAHTTMMAAAAPGNTATVAQLLPANRTEPGTWIDTFAAQSQWDSEGGAQMVEHRDQRGAVSARA